MDLYRSKQWRAFREQALRLADAHCSRCPSTRDQGAILHVHHKHYIVGRKPWDYEHKDCEVLCQSCHAQEHGLIPPKTDWEFVGYDDLGVPEGECEYCGTTIRHVFMIYHPKWKSLEVGEFCCDRLTSTNTATTYMRQRQRLLERRKRFVSHWSGNGHHASIQYKSFNVQVFTIDQNYQLRINGLVGRRVFSSQFDAKIGAFEFIDSGEAERYFSSRRRS